MKKITLLALVLCISVSSVAQDTNTYEKKIKQLEKNNILLQKQNAQLRTNVLKLENKLEVQNNSIDSLKEFVEKNTNKAIKTQQSIKKELNDTKKEQSTLQKSLGNRTIISIVLIFSVLIIALLVFYLLKKKVSKTAESISIIDKTQKSLQEESIKLDTKLVELLEAKIKVDSQTLTTHSVDHSLTLKVADEITRIEVNLSRMDSSIKGYKQLSASVRKIKDNLLANGYEIVEMLGKKYNDGIKASITFITDDSLAEGDQIITKVTKPQVNFNGKLIQQAQIQVSQGE
ncbi:MAG: hypothetical protein MJZ71_03185 [Bacteroidales bacterium]|nr:hypothetical protein [Bacteroidales bacterium]